MNDKKKILKLVIIALGLILLIVSITIGYYILTFQMFDESIPKEVKRITSPDSLVDAVLVEYSGNATATNSNLIYIVPKGNQIQKGYENFIADYIDSLEITWRENRYLLVKYDKARIFKYSNFWNSDKVNNWNYIVEIQLKPNKESSLVKNMIEYQ